jgi:hypothetical protein
MLLLPTWCACCSSAGHELGSVVADPGFVDASKNDYNLKGSAGGGGGGPAVKLGFVPLDLTKGVGPDW